MYEERVIAETKNPKLKAFFTTENTSWFIFGIIILAGIITRIFLWGFTSTDMDVWKEAADLLLQGINPYETTLESFLTEGTKHFYAYFPLWMYISALIQLIFPDAWFFGIVKGLTLLFDLQVVVLLFAILKPKIENAWRLKMPIAIWFVAPIVLMTSSMHGKFDSLMIIFILLACITYEKKQFIPESLFLSFAILTKPIALMLVPFFYKREIQEKNFRKLFAKIGLLILPIVLMSIPFLHEPVLYFQGVLGVHVTRGHDMAPLFALLSLPFSSSNADSIIRICLTVAIICVWLTIIVLSFVKKMDIYDSCFYSFLAFNILYWVFLVQYTVWIYTFYTITTTKSKLKHWQLGSLTSSLLLIPTIMLAVLGAFVRHGL
ncbi:MAG: hypothetical protein FK733_07840 [Asgard group archaeon]|nr:hypothetical protein [Asgard group archaeon]